MKRLFTLVIAILAAVSMYGQAPQRLSYQAVIRNAANNLVSNAAVGMRISILQGSAAGPSVYVETQTPTTNINGLATIVIGTGTLVSGNFTTINWGANTYFIKTETDPAGGTNYTITGTTQILSAPYALYANTAGSAVSAAPAGAASGDLTGNYPNPAIAANAVTAAKIANGSVTVAKINATGTPGANNFLQGNGAWSAVDISTADVTGNLPVARLNSGTSASATTFWRGDGTWGTPTTNPTGTAGGDLTGTYPNPTIAANAVTGTEIANGSVTVAKMSATGTPGANNFLQGNGIWSAVDISTADVTGNLPVSRLNSGTSASATTFWRGDGTWGTPTTNPTGAAGGALTGTYPNPTIAANAVTGTEIANSSVTVAKISAVGTPSANTVLQGNGTWNTVDLGSDVSGNLPVTRLNGGTSATVNTFWRGDGTWSVATPTGTAGGDLMGNYPNPTIDTNAVTSIKIADGTIATADLGNNAVTVAKINATGTPGSNNFLQGNGSWSAVDISTADITGNLPIARLNSGTSASATTFWRGDGTWATPAAPPTGAAGGDLMGTYPNPTIDTSAITSIKIADGTIATADLGNSAVTVAKINATGTASANTFLQGNGAWSAVDISSADVTGNLPVTKLNSGTAASATTFWRGDGTWATPPSGAALPTQTGNEGKFLTTNGTTTSWGTAGPSLYDDNNTRLGSIISFGRSYATVITSTGYIVDILLTPNGTNQFPIDQIYWSGSNCTGTPFLNDGGITGSVIYSKMLCYSGKTGLLYAPSNPNANGCSISTAHPPAATIENPSCMSGGGSSGWNITFITFTAAGLPNTIFYPLTIK